MTKDSGGELMIFDSAKTLVFSTEVGYEGDDSDKSVGPLSLMLAELRRVRMLEDARNSA
jgi:hypothetical protein